MQSLGCIVLKTLSFACNFQDGTFSLPLIVALTSHRWETAILTCGELFSLRLAWVLSSILTPQSWVPSGFIYIAFTQYRSPAPLTYADLCWKRWRSLTLPLSCISLTVEDVDYWPHAESWKKHHWEPKANWQLNKVHIGICFWPLRAEQDHKRGTLVANDKWFGQRRRPWPLLEGWLSHRNTVWTTAQCGSTVLTRLEESFRLCIRVAFCKILVLVLKHLRLSCSRSG